MVFNRPAEVARITPLNLFERFAGGQNTRVVDSLIEHDVVVVEPFGKIRGCVFVGGVDPSAIAEVTLAGVNIPIRIGNAAVLPVHAKG